MTGLTLNTSKSVYMIFKARKYKDYQCNSLIKVNVVSLNRFNECKYLSVIIKDNL